MQKLPIYRTRFYDADDNELVPCPVCNTLQFDKSTFPGTYDICIVCKWHDDSDQYYDPNLEGSPNEPSLNQAKENYKSHAISDLIIIEDIRESLILKLIYGFKLESKKTLSDRVEQNKTLWKYLERIIGGLFYPRFSYDDLDKLKTLINKFYDEEEAIALNRFAINFRDFMERVGIEQVDEVYTHDQEWDNLQKQAASLVELMQKNNHKYHFDKSYIPKQLTFTPVPF